MARDELSALLVRIGSAGDLDALAALFDRAAPGLLRLALRVTGDPVEAEDVLQETFLAVWKGAHTYDPARPAGAWLAAIVANAAARRNRKKTPGPIPEGAPPEAELAAPRRDDENWQRTRAAIERLPPREKSAMLLRYEQGLSPKQVAEILDVSESSVRSMLARGTERLRRLLVAIALPLPRGPRLTVVDALARVRDKVLAGTAATSAGSAAAAGSTLVTGGIVMGTKKVLVLGALALLGGTGTWAVLRDSTEATSRDGERTPVAVAAPAPNAPVDEARLHASAGSTEGVAGRVAAVPSAKAPRYSGRVHDIDGHAVPAVRVGVASAMGLNGPPDVSALSNLPIDSEGRFAFDLPTAHGQVTLRIEARGYAPQWGGSQTLVFPDVPLDVLMAKAVEVRVHVRDAAKDQPVVGAVAGVYGELTSSVDALRSQVVVEEGMTDASGLVVLHARVGTANVLVRAAGYSNSLVPSIEVASSGADVTVRLSRGTRIEGRFVDAVGRGRDDIRISAHGYPLYTVETRTDEAGRFVLEHAPSSSDPVEPLLRYHLDLFAQVPGGMPRWFHVDPPGEGETKSVTLVWKEGRPLHGRVLRSNGVPVAGFSVAPLPDDNRTRYGLSNWLASPVATDSDGRFAFAAVVPGTVLVKVWRGELWVAERSFVEKRLEIPETGEVPEVDLVVPDTPRSSLRVRVGESGGHALEGIAVAWVSADPVAPEVARGKTAADGEVVLEGEGRPGSFVVVDHLPYAPLRATVDEAVLSAGRLDLRMPPGTVKGHAVRLDGSPAPPLKVRITLLVQVAGRAWSQGVWGQSSLETDAEGSFEFRGLGDADYLIDVPDMTWRPLDGGVHVHAGDRDVRLVVGTEEETRQLHIEVELIDPATGQPFPGSPYEMMRVYRAGTNDRTGDPVAFLQGVSGLTGVHRTFHPLASGTYDVLVPAGYGLRESHIDGLKVGPGIDMKRRRYVLDRGERVRGRVIDAAGEPMKGLWLVAGRQHVFVRGDGTYEMTGLDAGTVEIKVTGRYTESEARLVDVRAGEPATADFQVTTGGAIEVALPAGARPASRMSVTAVLRTGGPPASIDLAATEFIARAARREDLVLPHLSPGSYRVEVVWDGRTISSETVEVADRATTRVEARP